MCLRSIHSQVNSDCASQAALAFAQENYAEAIERYEQAIENQPEDTSLYWHLGLALLLHGQEAEAQMTWMAPLLAAPPEQAVQWQTELLQMLQGETERQTAISAEKAWLLRQHIREIDPEDIDNLLQLVLLGTQTGLLQANGDLLLQITAWLQQHDITENPLLCDRLFECIQQLLKYAPEYLNTHAFLSACVPWIPDLQRLLNVLLTKAEILNRLGQLAPAAEIGKVCLSIAPDDDFVLLSVTSWLQQTSLVENLWQSIPLAKKVLIASQNHLDKIVATHMIMSGLMSVCGEWQETLKYCELHKKLLTQLCDFVVPELKVQQSIQQTKELEGQVDLTDLPNQLGMGALLLYFKDDPEAYRSMRNRLATACHAQLQQKAARLGKHYTFSAQSFRRDRPLRIGYLSECLHRHSIGWLARWLLKYHDRDRFDVHLYSLFPTEDLIQVDLKQLYSDRFHAVALSAYDVADKIYRDEIDILVELDSMTSLAGCGIVGLKPAPIQVHWLGFDASGIPSVDYFIADPYVLPDNAQTYYQEKIWRLPQTYIAVDGFEVDVPSLRREHLNIPSDAVVYLSSQTGLKRNPDNIRLQLKVIKAVPGSYFLIKSQRAKIDLLEAFFGQLADEEGVERDRLRFLPGAASEAIHRANLGIADVILDTYPYNGATTTLEALWMGLPIVTRVGQQFAARNSYTMMMNVGITEGLARSDDEYIEWGVRLGTDIQLREIIAYRLQQSRHTSPLWNGYQFAREMEKAYEQMWKQFQAKKA